MGDSNNPAFVHATWVYFFQPATKKTVNIQWLK